MSSHVASGTGRLGPIEDCGEVLGAEPGPGRLPLPARRQRAGVGRWVLGSPRAEGGDACRRPRRLAPVGHALLDLAPPLGEQLEDGAGDTVDLGVALGQRPPSHAELAGEGGAQVGTVEKAGGLGVEVEPTSVEGAPFPVFALHKVGDDDVRVQLRIQFAAGAVAERRADEAPGARLLDSVVTDAGHRGGVLQPRQRRLHRLLVAADHRGCHLRVAESEQHGHGLGGREAQVVAGQRPVGRGQVLAGPWVVACEHGPEVLRVHGSRQAEVGGARADPPALGLPVAEEVVLQALGDLVQVVVGTAHAELGDAQHGWPSGDASGTSPATSSHP